MAIELIRKPFDEDDDDVKSVNISPNQDINMKIPGVYVLGNTLLKKPIARSSKIPATYPAILDDGNTMVWSDYLEGITIETGVAQWDDKSGNNNHFIQSSTDSQPILTANGILFDGEDDSLRTPEFTLIQPTFIYLLLRNITWTTGRRIFDSYITSQAYLENQIATPIIRQRAGLLGATNTNLILNKFSILRVLFNGSSSKLQVDETDASILDPGPNNMGGINLGARSGLTTGASHIEVKEIIVRKIVDSETDEQDIYDYLAAKL